MRFRVEPACKDMLETRLSDRPESLSESLLETTLPFMMAVKGSRQAQNVRPRLLLPTDSG
ncbi:MAG: hypothetical protein CMM86_06275 [Rhodovulum sp.]|nr:hypothetical protein [Rhodovulum sp.]|tara:strand:- start:23 stop:202 length:180 start_codon:yes stop_codon:yes gene_type:complete